MQIEQAVYTSKQGGQVDGYQLVARSQGIDERLARSLTQCGPSHGALLSEHPHADSLNFQSIEDDWFALTRTLYGGYEYSARGGLRLVTSMLLLNSERMAAYAWDPLELAESARAIGALRLQPDPPRDLPTIDLPDPLSYSGDTPNVSSHKADRATSAGGLAVRARELLASGSRLAVVGSLAPLRILSRIIALTPVEERHPLTFTTGLRPSAHRQFRIQFLPDAEQALIRELKSQGVLCVEASTVNESADASSFCMGIC